MKFLKRSLWMLIGVIIGAASMTHLGARPYEQSPLEPILKVIAGGYFLSTGSAHYGFARFLYDPVSKACWLQVDVAGSGTSLSPAPESACASRPGFSR